MGTGNEDGKDQEKHTEMHGVQCCNIASESLHDERSHCVADVALSTISDRNSIYPIILY
jgi:hypothetical protein